MCGYLVCNRVGFEDVMSVRNVHRHAVLVGSLSGRFYVANCQVNCTLTPTRVVTAVAGLRRGVTTYTPLPSRCTTVQTLGNNERCSESVISVFARHESVLIGKVSRVPLLGYIPPRTAFCLVISVSRAKVGSIRFTARLLGCDRITIIPKITCNETYSSFVEVTFALSIRRVERKVGEVRTFMGRVE